MGRIARLLRERAEVSSLRSRDLTPQLTPADREEDTARRERRTGRKARAGHRMTGRQARDGQRMTGSPIPLIHRALAYPSSALRCALALGVTVRDDVGIDLGRSRSQAPANRPMGDLVQQVLAATERRHEEAETIDGPVSSFWRRTPLAAQGGSRESVRQRDLCCA